MLEGKALFGHGKREADIESSLVAAALAPSRKVHDAKMTLTSPEPDAGEHVVAVADAEADADTGPLQFGKHLPVRCCVNCVFNNASCRRGFG